MAVPWRRVSAEASFGWRSIPLRWRFLIGHGHEDVLFGKALFSPLSQCRLSAHSGRFRSGGHGSRQT
jgi:hypothetical protein